MSTHDIERPSPFPFGGQPIVRIVETGTLNGSNPRFLMTLEWQRAGTIRTYTGYYELHSFMTRDFETNIDNIVKYRLCARHRDTTGEPSASP